MADDAAVGEAQASATTMGGDERATTGASVARAVFMTPPRKTRAPGASRLGTGSTPSSFSSSSARPGVQRSPRAPGMVSPWRSAGFVHPEYERGWRDGHAAALAPRTTTQKAIMSSRLFHVHGAELFGGAAALGEAALKEEEVEEDEEGQRKRMKREEQEEEEEEEATGKDDK